VNKKDREQYRRNARYRAWRVTKAAGNKADDGIQWLFKHVLLPVGSLNRWPRLAHLAYVYRPHLTMAFIAAMWGSHITDHGPWWETWGPSVFFFAALWLTVVGDIHVTPQGKMCERCLDMSFPANGEAQAEAKMERLRFYHFERRKWNLRSAWLFIPWMITLIGDGWLIPWWGQLTFWSLIMLSGVAISVYCERPHRRLRYWCPWCREGDGALAPEPELDRVA
jgi:hypothetical protein